MASANNPTTNKKKKAKGSVDSWKLKSWYTIKAPSIFEGKEIGQVLSSEEENLPNRIIKSGLGEITGTFSTATAFTTVNMRIEGVSGKTVSTRFIGHELSASYLKTLLRRRRSLIHQVADVTTTDGKKVRIKTVAVTAFKVSESIRHDLRKAISAAIVELGSQMDFPTLAQDLVFGKFSAKVFGKVKHITPMRRLEVRKSELAESFDE